ncbi:MAG: hypothetical protein H0U23_16205 [Blastocatellia bacterium]|nr:hypothetical protein [Blastocatellia bacterium]
MNFTSRQKLGIALVLISLLGAAIIQSTTGDLVHITGDEEPPVGGPLLQTTFVMLTFTWRYAVPIVVCMALGLYYLLRPQRTAKPRS